VGGVIDVHDLHVWEVTSGFPSLSAHVLVDPAVDCHDRRLAIESMLGERFHIDHTTLQVDHRIEVLPTSSLGRRIHPESSRPTESPIRAVSDRDSSGRLAAWPRTSARRTRGGRGAGSRSPGGSLLSSRELWSGSSWWV